MVNKPLVEVNANDSDDYYEGGEAGNGDFVIVIPRCNYRELNPRRVVPLVCLPRRCGEHPRFCVASLQIFQHAGAVVRFVILQSAALRVELFLFEELELLFTKTVKLMPKIRLY